MAVVGQALTPTTYMTGADKARLRQIFGSTQLAGDDIEATYYSILGFTLLDEVLKEPQVSLV